jgi:hypothetical protein
MKTIISSTLILLMIAILPVAGFTCPDIGCCEVLFSSEATCNFQESRPDECEDCCIGNAEFQVHARLLPHHAHGQNFTAQHLAAHALAHPFEILSSFQRCSLALMNKGAPLHCFSSSLFSTKTTSLLI